MEAVKLPCAGQWLKVRDGDSLGSPLLASWDGPDSSAVEEEEEDQASDAEAEDDVSEASAESVASQATVTPETVSSSSAPAGRVVNKQHSPLRSSASERTDSEKDRDSAWDKDRSESRASSSTSAATLTNTKESCNRRLLRSDLSLTSHPEMEIDYYDYEVNNAGSVPGSYLGMDPAFLEILPKELLPDPGSNTESPEEAHPASTLKRNDNRFNHSNESIKSFRKDRGNIIHPFNFSISDLQNTPRLSRRNRKKKPESPLGIPMRDLSLTRSPVKIHRSKNDDNASTLKRINDNARETEDTDKLKSSDFADIKFADENSDSSNDMKFADDSSPDSNRISDRYNIKV
ncbi:Uncharacterized protein OBRU01_23026 [Operophtera brumata]|uniref:Uncharacterized protein n=1 Tax=Operophtera brumata TaxID=104452 RepID=A0A0L7KPN3_OPEBR|nr:Uncharacterized protein OBRU01_23026 [Operophtera brumata]